MATHNRDIYLCIIPKQMFVENLKPMSNLTTKTALLSSSIQHEDSKPTQLDEQTMNLSAMICLVSWA
jgi:hypothetical protein